MALYINGVQMDIEIIRPKQFQDKIRDYHLYADGNKLIKIKPNSSQVISVPSHTKYIEAKIDWCSSPKFYLDNSPSKKLIVKNRISGGFFKALILPMYYITFGRRQYLKIENSK
jgi:hypothetical protein